MILWNFSFITYKAQLLKHRVCWFADTFEPFLSITAECREIHYGRFLSKHCKTRSRPKTSPNERWLNARSCPPQSANEHVLQNAYTTVLQQFDFSFTENVLLETQEPHFMSFKRPVWNCKPPSQHITTLSRGQCYKSFFLITDTEDK